MNPLLIFLLVCCLLFFLLVFLFRNMSHKISFTRSGSCFSRVCVLSRYKCLDNDEFIYTIRYHIRRWARTADLVRKKKRMFVLFYFIVANLDILFRPEMSKILAVVRAKIIRLEQRIPGVRRYRAFIDNYRA